MLPYTEPPIYDSMCLLKRCMKIVCLVLSVFLLINPAYSYCQEYGATPPVSSVAQDSLAQIELDFDKVLNLDELEEEMVKMNIIDSIKPIPPHPIIVWIRIIGCPVANAYFAVRRVVRQSIHTIATFLRLKSDAKAYEESPAE